MIAGLAYIIYAINKNNEHVLTSRQWVVHAEKVISQAETILSLSKDIETAYRGFVYTNDSVFLEPFFIAEKEILRSIHNFNQLNQTNASQLLRSKLLDSLITQKLLFVHSSIKLKNDKNNITKINLTSVKSGYNLTDKIKNIILEIKEKEKELLKNRQATKFESLKTLKNIKTFLIFLISILAFSLLILLSHSLYEKKEKINRAIKLELTNKALRFQENQKLQLLEANKELEAFSYSVSHDLRAPLRHISGYVDLLMKKNKGQLDASGQRYLQTISESAKEMGDLIDALLNFSRLSRSEIQKIQIHHRTLIDRILKMFKEEIDSKEIKFIIHDLPDSNANENLIHQVWLNLISNAIKYTRHEKKPIIEIGAEVGSNETNYFIKDNGAGFDMKYASKLFGVFQRLHKSSEFEGIGIGLANVNRIISRHKGTCRAEGSVGKGATFYFSLPLNA